jgi:hypothetical protein
MLTPEINCAFCPKDEIKKQRERERGKFFKKCFWRNFS